MPTSLTPDQVLDRLRRGNQVFRGCAASTGIAASSAISRQRPRFDARLADGQDPWAAILTCSDSRVACEHIFSADPGDLFTVRNAGAVVSAMAVGSLEFAVEALNVPVVLVIRHSRCGAVLAAAQGEQPEPAMLRRAVETIADHGRAAGLTGADAAEEIGRVHLERSLAELRAASPTLRSAEEAGRVRILPGMYDITTGEAHLDQVL